MSDLGLSPARARRERDPSRIFRILCPELNHVSRGERECGLVRRRIRAVIPDCEIAYAANA
jgi:hypothetical protein